MWPFPDCIEEWFDKLRDKKKEDRRHVSDDRDEVPLLQNEDPRVKALKQKTR